MQTHTGSKTRLVEQINACLRSGEYSRALDLLRGAAAEFPGDAEHSRLEKLAQDGVKRKAEADSLITQSQDLFAQQKSAEAIRLLRKAYELDKNNSLARAILANALVEHAHSVVETDWLEAETLTNEALALNPAHPTAKTILSLIIYHKETSPVEKWVSQARKLQSSGDLFATLGWVAEGLAVHPNDPKLLQIQDEIQRDQGARRRQSRRRDLEDLRRIELEIDQAANLAAKKALAERIQALAAKYWTDGEILGLANSLLHRLGLVPDGGSTASPQSKGGTVIFHVPRPSAPKPYPAEASQVPPSPVLPSAVSPSTVSTERVSPASAPLSEALLRIPPRGKLRTSQPKPQPHRPQAASAPAVEPSAPVAKVTVSSSPPKQAPRSNSSKLILVAAAAMILIAASFLLLRRHYAGAARTPASALIISAPAAPPPVASPPAIPAPAVSAPAQTAAEPSPPPSGTSPEIGSEKVPLDNQPLAEPGHNQGTLLVVAGQDEARVFLNGQLQRQLTQAGELRLPNLAPREYVVQVSKAGFQDPPQQKIRIRRGEQARLVFSLQLQPRLASLSVQGGAPGTTVFVDQTLVGSIQPDGTLSISTLNPGDHTVELRKDRSKSRQFKKHFVAGATISLTATDTVLEAASGELKITFAPADANVAIVKGDFLKMVSSGVPLNLAPGTYTLTARTAERFTRSSTLEVIAGQSKTLDLSLAPSGMSKWEDPGAWKHEGDSFIRKGGDFVLYGAVPASGTFAFSAMLLKGHVLQWMLNYTDPRNYVFFQMDDNNFYRSVIHNGEKTDEIIVPHKADKKSFRTLQIRFSSTEIVHQIKQGESWKVLDRWTQPGANLSLGKFGFYLPGNDQIALSSFAHYADLNIH